MPSAHLIVDVTKVPEVLAGLRNVVARLLVEAAKDEEPGVAARLIEIAAMIEAGVEDYDV